jgi:hypothetical protein
MISSRVQGANVFARIPPSELRPLFLIRNESGDEDGYCSGIDAVLRNVDDMESEFGGQLRAEPLLTHCIDAQLRSRIHVYNRIRTAIGLSSRELSQGVEPVRKFLAALEALVRRQTILLGSETPENPVADPRFCQWFHVRDLNDLVKTPTGTQTPRAEG